MNASLKGLGEIVSNLAGFSDFKQQKNNLPRAFVQQFQLKAAFPGFVYFRTGTKRRSESAKLQKTRATTFWDLPEIREGCPSELR